MTLKLNLNHKEIKELTWLGKAVKVCGVTLKQRRKPIKSIPQKITYQCQVIKNYPS